MRVGKCHRIAVTTALALGMSAVWAGTTTWQSLGSVREAVVHFLRETLEAPGEIAGVRVQHLDPRLHLAACSAPLEPFLLRKPTRSGRVTVGVRCTAPEPWKLYVPAQITRLLPVVTTTHPIPRGTPIGADDVHVERVQVSSLRGSYYRQPETIVGLRARHAIGAGEVISSRDVSKPLLVRRGQILIIQASSATVAISMKGKALENGARGELVRVRNLSSDRVIQARVAGRDRVRVTF